MEKEHTPAVIRPNRTVYRFTKEQAIAALSEHISNCGEGPVPEGALFIWVPGQHGRDDWALTLGVDHPDPPPTGKDVKDE